MKKLFAIIILVCSTIAANAQEQVLERLYAVQPGANVNYMYNGNVSISKVAASAQYLNFGREGGNKWSLGTVYNSNTFAIGLSTISESSFTSPFFNLTPTGNVGIGTTTPISKLEINAFGSAPSSLLYGATDFINLTGVSNNASGLNLIAATSAPYYRGVFKATRSRGTPTSPTTVANGDVVLTLIGSAYNGVGAYATAGINTVIDGNVSYTLVPQALTFETGSGLSRLERMRITSGGNIGIGTTTPITSAKLTISEADANGSQLTLLNTRSGGNRYVFAVGDYGSSALAPGAFCIYDIARAKNDFTIKAGNIGIGTTSPTSKLHISNTTALSGISGASIDVTQTQANPTDLSDIGLSVNYNLTASSGAGELVYKGANIRTNNYLTGGGVVQYQRVLNLSSGSISGANTTNLEMIRIEAGTSTGTTTNAYGINIASLPGTNKWGIYDQSGGNWYTNGKVGIGTIIPDELLTVNGTIHAKEVKIDVTGYADYVFEKGYKLMPISEIHSFISENGHLPEIPSEEEVMKNGLNVADMQVMLLKKIEDLTLYAIEQQKRIEALEKTLKEK